DADLDAALEGAMLAKFRNAGQTCVCANRILVQRGLYARFVEALTERVQALQVGPGLQAGVNIGPLIDQAALERVEARVADAQRQGARLMCGGQRLPLGALFYAPTVLADVTADMRIAREEIFGPVAPVLPFDTETDAIALANATEHGLAAYLYTRDLARSWRVSEALKVGMVGLNTGLISNEVAPFGGVNQSGYGREGSRYGIEAYQTLKYVCVEVGGPQV
ncbi:MAG: aldehyde dehydrogenase family protein, partial [Gammaproteobacteria bacterium]|nr:aldehyde dehydrogenase family protein [Gammaproteobacteria bacterium]